MSPLAVAQRVPPAAAVMVDDDDLALAAAVFQAAAGAFRAVEPPHRWQPLQQRRAAYAGLQLLDFCVLLAHGSCSARIARQKRDDVVCSLYVLYRWVGLRQPRSRRGARACAARERAARRTLAARQAQAVALSSGLFCLCARDRHRQAETRALRPGERPLRRVESGPATGGARPYRQEMPVVDENVLVAKGDSPQTGIGGKIGKCFDKYGKDRYGIGDFPNLEIGMDAPEEIPSRIEPCLLDETSRDPRPRGFALRGDACAGRAPSPKIRRRACRARAGDELLLLEPDRGP